MKGKWKWLGLLLILVSLGLWCTLPVIPFLPLTGAQLAIWLVVQGVIGEVAFYSGSIIAGKEVVQAWWAKLKRKKKENLEAPAMNQSS